MLAPVCGVSLCRERRILELAFGRALAALRFLDAVVVAPAGVVQLPALLSQARSASTLAGIRADAVVAWSVLCFVGSFSHGFLIPRPVEARWAENHDGHSAFREAIVRSMFAERVSSCCVESLIKSCAGPSSLSFCFSSWRAFLRDLFSTGVECKVSTSMRSSFPSPLRKFLRPSLTLFGVAIESTMTEVCRDWGAW